MLILYAAAALLGLFILLLLGLYLMAFYAPPRPKELGGEIKLPSGRAYVPYQDEMRQWIIKMRAMDCREMSISSHDGLRLCARYYEFSPDSPLELMFHGYRGNAERDLAGGIERCFALGRSCIIVDQRCSGMSQGRTISFGINEMQDCLRWIDHTVSCFPERKIILTGISMGAATVLMAAGEKLHENVVGVLADCGYTSARAVIYHVIRSLHLPAKPLYPLVRLAGRIFGGIDIEKSRPIEAVARCTVPVIFFHGEADDFVPCYMSRENFEACPARKALVTIPGAGHGLSYPADKARYLKELGEFFKDIG